MPSGIYVRTIEHKRKLSESIKGEKNYLYRPIGSEHIRLDKKTGVLRVSIKTQDGWMPRARYVMEQVLNRRLESWEYVHHKDGNTLNDDPINLQIVSLEKHMSLHCKGKIFSKDHKEKLSKAHLGMRNFVRQ